MKTVFAAFALALALAGSVQAAGYTNTTNNGGLPDWAVNAFERLN